MIKINGTHIHYYTYCKRKLWLSINHINMEHTSEHVLEGKMIESESFKRRSEKNKQIQLGSIKIDYIDKDKKIIYETKKSSKNLEVSIMQIKYYLYIINDIEWKGVIEIPKEKKES